VVWLGVAVGVSLGVAVAGAAVLCVASTDGVGLADVEIRGQNFQTATTPPDSRTMAAKMGTTMRAALRFARRALATISPRSPSLTRANVRYRAGIGNLSRPARAGFVSGSGSSGASLSDRSGNLGVSAR
jgi:hypothetical protein